MLEEYRLDIAQYKIDQASAPSKVIYVTRVAREFSTEDRGRHVAAEYYAIDMLDKKTVICLGSIRMAYDAAYKEAKRQASLHGRNAWAFKAFFELAIGGSAKFPSEIGGEHSVSQEERSRLIGCLKQYIDDTIILTDNWVNEQGRFPIYCTNCCITPEWVKPDAGEVIPEVSLGALWYGKEHMSDATRELLVDRGVLSDKNDGHWAVKHRMRSMLRGEEGTAGLDTYVKAAEEERKNYPPDKEFISPKHYLYLRYPYFGNDEKGGKLSEPRVGQPAFKIGFARDLTSEDIEIYERPKLIQEEEFNGVRKFEGITCEDFIEIKGDIKYPGKGKPMNFINKGVIYAGDAGNIPYADIEKLDPSVYPISKLTGRKTLFYDTSRRLWEVVV
jgi:hypothetical protein